MCIRENGETNCGVFKQGMNHWYIQQHWLTLKNMLSKSAGHKRTFWVVPFIEILEEAKLIQGGKKPPKNTITVVASEDEEEWLGRDVEALSGEMEMFQIIGGLWVTCMCPYVRLYRWDLWISVYVYSTSKNGRKIIIEWRVGRGKKNTRMARY